MFCGVFLTSFHFLMNSVNKVNGLALTWRPALSVTIFAMVDLKIQTKTPLEKNMIIRQQQSV